MSRHRSTLSRHRAKLPQYLYYTVGVPRSTVARCVAKEPRHHTVLNYHGTVLPWRATVLNRHGTILRCRSTVLNCHSTILSCHGIYMLHQVLHS